MLDVARPETSPDTRRHELAGKIAEGRTVIAALLERYALLGEKIDAATSALRRMEQQYQALDSAGGVVSEEEVLVHTPATPEVRTRPVEVPPAKPAPFQPFAYLRCVVDGHDMVVSRSVSGRMTCRRCRIRHKL